MNHDGFSLDRSFRFREGQRYSHHDLNRVLECLWALADRVDRLERSANPPPAPKPESAELDGDGQPLD